ncbi:hypothetical protein DNTS_031637, partial [Danionella cerebrum]
MDLHPITLLLLLNLAPAAAAQQELSACYILDGILIIYGLLLTVLYCRCTRPLGARCVTGASIRIWNVPIHKSTTRSTASRNLPWLDPEEDQDYYRNHKVFGWGVSWGVAPEEPCEPGLVSGASGELEPLQTREFFRSER